MNKIVLLNPDVKYKVKVLDIVEEMKEINPTVKNIGLVNRFLSIFTKTKYYNVKVCCKISETVYVPKTYKAYASDSKGDLYDVKFKELFGEKFYILTSLSPIKNFDIKNLDKQYIDIMQWVF